LQIELSDKDKEEKESFGSTLGTIIVQQTLENGTVFIF